MKNKISTALCSLLLVSSLHANEKVENKSFIGDDLGLFISIDKDNHILPDVYLPINWNNNFSTSIEFRQLQDESSSNGTDTVLDSEFLNFYALKYSDHNSVLEYSFGLGYSSEKYDKNQVATSLNYESDIN